MDCPSCGEYNDDPQALYCQWCGETLEDGPEEGTGTG